MTHVVILHLTQNGHEQVIAFHSIRQAYDWLQQTAQRLFPNDPTVYIEPFDYIANEICERILIGNGQLTPTAWNQMKTWKASLAKTSMIEEIHSIFT